MQKTAYETSSGQLNRVLARLLEKAVSADTRVVVHSPILERLEAIDGFLWTYHPSSFLPHALGPAEDAEFQPIWLTDKIENPNKASLLVLLDTQEDLPFEKLFEKVFFVFPEEEAPIVRKVLAESSPIPLYWRQSPEGGWIKILE